VKAQELSRKYATAVFSQALDKWLTTLGAVRDKLANNPALSKSLQDSAHAFSDKQKELDKIIPTDSDQSIRNFLYVMLRDGNIGSLAEVLADLEQMIQGGGPQVQIAHVTTALSLAENDREQFRQKLGAKYGQNLELVFNVDPAIVGGVVVQIGDKVIDGSVANRLESMSNMLGVR